SVWVVIKWVKETMMSNSSFETIVAVATLLLLLMFVSENWNWLKIPGPIPWPIIGNLGSLKGTKFLSIHEMYKIYGRIFRLKFGRVKAVVLCDVELIKEALLDRGRSLSGRPQFASYRLVSGCKSVVTNDPRCLREWVNYKSTMVQTLCSISNNNEMKELMNERIGSVLVYMIQELEKGGDGQNFAEDIVTKTVANFLCTVCYGETYDFNSKEFNNLIEMSRHYTDNLSKSILRDMIPLAEILPSVNKGRADFAKTSYHLHLWFLKRVEEVIQHFQPNKLNDLASVMVSDLTNDPTENISNITEKDRNSIAAIINDLVQEGYHSLYSMALWVVTYMIKYPEEVKKIENELNEVLDDYLPTLHDQESLPHTMAFINEVLRCRPSLPLAVPHSATEDTKLGGYDISKDTMVVASLYSANRDPKVWANPDQFDPSRFLAKDDLGVKVLDETKVEQVFTFSLGDRKCPGEDIGRSFLFLTTAYLAHTCKLKPDPAKPPTFQTKPGSITRPKDFGVQLNVKKCWLGVFKPDDNEE
uniref:Cytochrome P450 1A1-like n=1 Tax=Ciona intestinalis TaxID=7719 RepID=H2Y0X8_CIOIN